jgi:hypothetical protein
MAMKPIVLSEQNWAKLRFHLMETQPKSVMLTRWKMREVLGFTDRLHTEWVEKPDSEGYQRRQVHLDFFDEAKKTMFLLKYSDWIKSEDSRYR